MEEGSDPNLVSIDSKILDYYKNQNNKNNKNNKKNKKIKY